VTDRAARARITARIEAMIGKRQAELGLGPIDVDGELDATNRPGDES
jgi:hypothetical protein